MKINVNRERMVMFSAISLTDIVLLLLIFFMLTSSFVVQPGIRIKLPKAVSGEQVSETRIYLTVNRDQQIFLNQQLVPQASLGEHLRQLLADHPERLVVIRADKGLSLEKTIDIIDIAQLAGAERFMIATEQKL